MLLLVWDMTPQINPISSFSGSFPASGTDLAPRSLIYSIDKLLKSAEVKVMPFMGPQRTWTLDYNLQSDQVAQPF